MTNRKLETCYQILPVTSETDFKVAVFISDGTR